MARLAMFVDGWNFYWSLVDAGIKPYGWCNFAMLARQQTGFGNPPHRDHGDAEIRERDELVTGNVRDRRLEPCRFDRLRENAEDSRYFAGASALDQFAKPQNVNVGYERLLVLDRPAISISRHANE